MNDPNQHPNPNKWWLHRRLAMYISLASSIIQTILFSILAYHKPESMLALGAVVGFSYGFFTMVCLAYFSNTALQEYMERKS